VPAPRFTAGLDLEQLRDFTALAVLERVGDAPRPRPGEDAFHVRHLHRWPLGSSYPSIVADVGALLAREPLNGAARLALDNTGVGTAVTDLFRQAAKPTVVGHGAGGRPVIGAPAALRVERLMPVTITGGATVGAAGGGFTVPKRDLVAGVAVALQTARLRIAPDLPHAATLVEELLNFRFSISAAGHATFGAGQEWREGNHDDLVLAVAIGLWAAEQTVGYRLQSR
jgi:hypothetical protein